MYTKLQLGKIKIIHSVFIKKFEKFFIQINQFIRKTFLELSLYYLGKYIHKISRRKQTKLLSFFVEKVKNSCKYIRF